MLTITIDRDAQEPVYVQVAAQVRKLVASGGLGPGTALPSVRQLAGDLGVSLNTIARAYRLLEAEGFVSIRDRAGAVVAAPADDIDHATRSTLLEQLRVTIVRLRQAGMASADLLRFLEREVEALDQCEEGAQR